MFGPAIFGQAHQAELSQRARDYRCDPGSDRSRTFVIPHLVDGWWKDTGKLEDMLEANRLILETFTQRIEGTVDETSRVEGKVVIEEGAVIERAIIRGPAIIGARARLSHATSDPCLDHERRRNPRLGDRAQHRPRRLANSRPCDIGTRVADNPIQRAGITPRSRQALGLSVHAR